jgi:hypothetical protein
MDKIPIVLTYNDLDNLVFALAYALMDQSMTGEVFDDDQVEPARTLYKRLRDMWVDLGGRLPG